MKSSLPKVLHPVAGVPMIEIVLDAAREAGIKDIIVVAGDNYSKLKPHLGIAEVVIQKKPLGSGDAVNQVRNKLKSFKGDLIILYGDAPLVRPSTIKHLLSRHESSGALATLLSCRLRDPSGYGRIIRNDDDTVVKIVEEQDANIYQKVIDEVNSGTAIFKAVDLFDALKNIKPNNQKKEYYLTDVIEILARKGTVESISSALPEEIIGINTRYDLSQAQAVARERLLKNFMLSGVTIIDPLSTYIEYEVNIKPDTIIYPNTIIERGVKIGAGCKIGPFARLRKGAIIRNKAQVGNFCEIVRSTIGEDSRVKHHSYIGDAIIGKKVNVGAGTITANYDGKKKHKTIIKDNALIGSGTTLIAPLVIGRSSVTGANSVITKNTKVPDNSVICGVPAKIKNKGKKK